MVSVTVMATRLPSFAMVMLLKRLSWAEQVMISGRITPVHLEARVNSVALIDVWLP